MLTHLLSFITTLVAALSGAFFGAWAAFHFNKFRSKQNKKKKNIASLVRAKYVIRIILLYNKLLNDHINKYKNTPNGDYFEWQKILRYHPTCFIPSLDPDSLLFLLEDKKKGEKILDSIWCVDSQNNEVLSVLELRNNEYNSYLNKIEGRDVHSKDELINIIGMRSISDLENFTKNLIKTNANLLEDCEIAIKNIEEELNKLSIKTC